MFTGLVEAVGQVVEVQPRSGSTRISVGSELPLGQVALGESIAVDGVCLTVVEKQSDRFVVDAVTETLAATTLEGFRPGRAVNLERALALGDRLGGHLVQGHVDGTVRLISRRQAGDDHRLAVELPVTLRHLVARKGSVALNGVSLTVAAVDGRSLEVVLVPHTLRCTNLGGLAVGDPLNVEVDLLARYLDRLRQFDNTRER